jgi:GAF domain-containing protein
MSTEQRTLLFAGKNPEVPGQTLEKWQGIADIAADVIGVPAGLIMRVHSESIEVFISSRTEGTPYEAGDSESLNSGLYCETVMSTRSMLLVPNALEDADWENNPDVDLGMISYLGMPLHWPDEEAFGTICVLDNKTNHFNDKHIELLKKLRDAVEADLANIRYIAELEQAVQMIGELQQILPICSNCKKVRDSDGYWNQVEDYLLKRANIQFTHSYCEDCRQLFMD